MNPIVRPALRRLASFAWLPVAALAMTAGACALAQPPAPLQFSGEPKLEFTQSTTAGLAQTKRVAIAALVLEVQTRVKAEYVTGRLSKMVLHRDNTSSTNSLKGYQLAALQNAADRLHDQLAEQLRAAGYEVVSQVELQAQPAYQKLVDAMGHPQGTGWDNAEGNSFLVGPRGMKLYVPNPAEQPTFSLQKKGVGRADEPSLGLGDNMRRGGEGSYSAGREVEVAKALNAHLLKAWYVVGFGAATADTAWDGAQSTVTGGGFTTTTTTGATQTSGAHAQLYVRAEASRLALRHPNGDTAFARSARHGTFNALQHAYDGDLVIRLDDTVVGAADFLAAGGVEKKAEDKNAVAGAVTLGVGLLRAFAGTSGSLGDKADDYETKVDPERFAQRAAEVAGWVQDRMVARLKP